MEIINHTALAMGIMENDSEADMCSDKIFCELHFCVFERFYLIITEYIYYYYIFKWLEAA